MLLFDGDGRVLVAQRIDIAGAAWQLPQGGMDEGEPVRSAARRELREEIGTDAVAFLAESPDWIAYDLPADLDANPWRGRYRGQRVKLVAFRFTGADDDIDLETESPEFRAWRWVELEELPALIVPFKRPLYESAVRQFEALRDSLRRDIRA
jgi:putative (di)nucleoside polyphosphate hydrolase